MKINNKNMKTIEELAEEYCVKNIPNLKDMHLTISTAFEAGFEKSQEWISVDDELPKLGQLVLVMINNGQNMISTARYGGHNQFHLDCFDMYSTNVTHWRPIERR